MSIVHGQAACSMKKQQIENNLQIIILSTVYRCEEELEMLVEKHGLERVTRTIRN